MPFEMTAGGYRRRQRVAWIAAFGFALSVIALFLPRNEGLLKVVAVAIGALAVTVSFFAELSIMVDEQNVRWQVGPKSGSVPLVRIERVGRIELGLSEGWRAHWTVWHGWMWSTGRFRAVEITMTDGSRVVLGTGAPTALYSAIADRLQLPG